MILDSPLIYVKISKGLLKEFIIIEILKIIKMLGQSREKLLLFFCMYVIL
jgi:hypothetical protein